MMWRYLDFRALVILASLGMIGCALPVKPEGVAAGRELLTPWVMITGGPVLSPLGAKPGVNAGHVQLRHPTAVSALGNDVYLVDAGLRRIYRYNRAQLSLEPFTTLAADASMRLYAGPDLSVYVADPVHSRVLQFSWNGQLLQTFSNEASLSRPIAVTMDDAGGRVLVADGLYDQVVAFNRMGLPLHVINQRNAESPVQSIADMSRGQEGLYLIDRLARQVVVLDLNGAYRRAFGKGELVQPGAIAVDKSNRVYVSDNFDNTIKVFAGGKLVKKFGGSGSIPGLFNQITALSENQGMLYVADSLNARIQILLVSPGTLDGATLH